MAQGTGTNRNCLQMMPGAMAFHEPGTAVGAVLICFRNTLLTCRTHFATIFCRDQVDQRLLMFFQEALM